MIRYSKYKKSYSLEFRLSLLPVTQITNVTCPKPILLPTIWESHNFTVSCCYIPIINTTWPHERILKMEVTTSLKENENFPIEKEIHLPLCFCHVPFISFQFRAFLTTGHCSWIIMRVVMPAKYVKRKRINSDLQRRPQRETTYWMWHPPGKILLRN